MDYDVSNTFSLVQSFHNIPIKEELDEEPNKFTCYMDSTQNVDEPHIHFKSNETESVSEVIKVEIFTDECSQEDNKIVNNSENTLKCGHCKTQFTDINLLESHMKIHVGTKYMCESCKKVFPRLDHLQQHRLIHTGKKLYCCGVCSQEFNNVKGLSTHMQEHFKYVPQKINEAVDTSTIQSSTRFHSGATTEECSKIVNNKSEKNKNTETKLKKKNEKIHLAQQPYTCGVCEKSFVSESILKSHIKTHVQVRPYKCTICNKRFKTLELLMTHQEIHRSLAEY